ncbi:hypothetical protein E3E12_03285 [Formicincola oecophyllae]|uniref:Type I-E CRISPR-associated protein Cse2/CasB n=1 Tax=Formicincola oecophyllae TaxID=2558361 RepID=A0A4Y6UA96_9PROT|nr:hypothetical protein [Formicincola oecophyllae]QDH13386.1 hypothetical protein E3E12_03285 [Formicincola oecophyllae]
MTENTPSPAAQPPTMNMKECLKEKRLKELITHDLPRMMPGPLAQLRRGGNAGRHVPEFWKLWVKYDLGLVRLNKDEEARYPEGSAAFRKHAWALALQALASLRPKGQPGAAPAKFTQHPSEIPLGKAMALGKVSNLRMSRLLSAPYGKRAEMMLRLLPLISQDQKFNLVELGLFILNPDQKASEKLAESYYYTLEQIEKASS